MIVPNNSYCPFLYKYVEDKVIDEIKVKGVQRQDDNISKIGKKDLNMSIFGMILKMMKYS